MLKKLMCVLLCLLLLISGVLILLNSSDKNSPDMYLTPQNNHPTQSLDIKTINDPGLRGTGVSTEVVNTKIIGNGNAPSITTDNEGTIYLVWVNLQSDEVLFSRSEDTGMTFSDPVVLGEYGGHPSKGSPSIAVDNQDIYVVWGNGYGVHFVRSSDGGALFTQKETLNESVHPSVSIATEDGNVYIAYTWTECVWCDDIKLLKSNNGGLTFLDEVDVCNEGFNLYPSIAVDGENVYVAFEGGSGNLNKYARFARSTDGGLSFEQPIDVVNTESLLTDGDRSITLDRDGNIYVAWYSESGVYISKSVDSGKSFLGPKPVNDGNTTGRFPSVAAHTDVHVAWVGDESIAYDKSKDNAVSFGVDMNLGKTGDVEYYSPRPSISIGDAGTYIVWATEDSEIYFAHTDQPPESVHLNEPSGITQDSVTLIWTENADTDFSRYELHMSTEADFEISQSTKIANITNQTTTSYTVEGLSENKTYCLKVRIYDINGLYADSNEVSAKTLPSLTSREETTFYQEFVSFSKNNLFNISVIAVVVVVTAIGWKLYLSNKKLNNQ